MFLEFPSTDLISEKVQILSDRAHMMRQVRDFFFKRDVLEVDTPLLSRKACVDAYIDLMQTQSCEGEIAFLHSSPEYAMKKLLSYGMPDIYQMSHVFRKDEHSKKHQPEFMMIEWYRHQVSLDTLLLETLGLIMLFLTTTSTKIYSYEELFEKHLQINPLKSKESEIQHKAFSLGLTQPTLESSLYFLWDHIESTLEQDVIIVVKDFPSNMAALSNTYEKNGYLYAKRFEVYLNSLELANGFDELLDPIEQRCRLEKENLKRKSLGKETLPLDEIFITALGKIKPCCGVAVGFDRLMMLRHHADRIQDIVSLPYMSSN